MKNRKYYEKFRNAKLMSANIKSDLLNIRKDALLCIENTNVKWDIQVDKKDDKTGFIYNVYTYKRLLEMIASNLKENPDLAGYAKHRWINKQASLASENVFCSYNIVRKEPNSRLHGIDFYICGIPFDLKVTTFPKKLKHISKSDAKVRKNEVIHWLYKNQSRGKRYSVGNRIFIMTLSDNELECTKSKFDFDKITTVVNEYLNSVVSNLRANKLPFNEVHLNLKNTPKTKFSPGGDFQGNVFADILFIE